MCVYILSHADVKYLFFQLGSRCTGPLLLFSPAFLNKSVDYQWEMGVHLFGTRYQLWYGLWVDGQRMLNLQWEMGDGKRETTDPAARSLDAVLDSAGWSVKDGRSQRDMGNWQTGRGLMAHEPWPMSTGTVLKLSPRGPFAR